MSITIEKIAEKTLPTIALRGIVLFPHVITSFEIARKASIKALKQAQESGTELFLAIQRDASVISPKADDLYEIGITAKIKHALRLTNGNYQLVVEGQNRAERMQVSDADGCLVTRVHIRDISELRDDTENDRRLIREAWAVFNEYLKYVQRPSQDIVAEARKITDPGLLADCLGSTFLVKFEDRQQMIEILDGEKRLEALLGIFRREIDLIELEGSIQTKVRYNLQRGQREIYLREQLKAIQSELNIDESGEEESDEYYTRIEEAKLPAEVAERLHEEDAKLARMPFGTPEATVIRNYIETCLELPWSRRTRDRLNIQQAAKILDEDHDGLRKVKDRILEFMAVKQLSPKLDGQIICLVGPPGVGKSSIAKSIARATNRKYVRISLGGIRDEAEIRGHRKTYIGSMPGRIIAALKLAGSMNPVILLDEVDKLTTDAHGDPTSALLEVLDTDQNKQFRDHFIELPVDLSECLFIATANTAETIPAPLLDRMEVIDMDSYSDAEKLSIAKNHLIAKQLKRHGLTKRNLSFTDGALQKIIRSYTKESGVRNLEREIASVCRKVARDVVSTGTKTHRVDESAVAALLGPEKFLEDRIYPQDEIGIVNGLAWTSLGGELLRVEVLSMQGNGNLELTGHLGDVMKESARAAVSYIRKHAESLGVDPDFYKTRDIHIHVPEGAIPKDGPSAGIAMTTALISELSGRPVRQDVAMTGEITLTGRVLPIGGLKEKSMAARKAGATTVIVPQDNLRDVEEFDADVREHIRFVGVTRYTEVFEIAFRKDDAAVC